MTETQAPSIHADPAAIDTFLMHLQLEAQRMQRALELNQLQQQRYMDEYDRRGGWTRAFLVNNTNGHVHKSMGCSTCFADTQFAWLTGYSGQTEEQIIEAAGMRACTVCYPDAPAETLSRPGVIKTDEDKRLEQVRADRAEKAKARNAKAIFMPNGDNLRNEWGIIKTERSAEIEATADLANIIFYGYEHPTMQQWNDFAVRAAEALAHKRGTDFDTEIMAIGQKAAAKAKRDTAEAAKHAKRMGW